MPAQEEKSAHSVARERRKYPRLPVQIPVYFKANSNKEQQAALTMDISPYGLKILTPETDISSGSKIQFIAPTRDAGPAPARVEGRVIWTEKDQDKIRTGIAFENRIEDVLSYLLFMLSSRDSLLNAPFFQSLLDGLPDSSILVDADLRILAISSNQYFLPCDPKLLRGEKIGSAPTILKQLAGEDFDLNKAISKCFFNNKPLHFSALSLERSGQGPEENRYFNVNFMPLTLGPGQQMVLVQIKDVTALCQLKEKIKEKNNALWSQYKFLIMGQIVDELLEDLISPLSAVVGRLDLLTMKMNSVKGSESPGSADDWLRELNIISGLVDQITEFCTVAAKRREREKLGSMEKTISFNKLVDETLVVLKPKSSFRKVNVRLNFKKDLPEFKGDYFDWLNALIALFQIILKEMKSLSRKEMVVTTDVQDEYVLLSVSHNARALKIPLEKEIGLGILEILREKYGVSIKTSGSNGCQTITFRVKKEQEESFVD